MHSGARLGMCIRVSTNQKVLRSCLRATRRGRRGRESVQGHVERPLWKLRFQASVRLSNPSKTGGVTVDDDRLEDHMDRETITYRDQDESSNILRDQSVRHSQRWGGKACDTANAGLNCRPQQTTTNRTPTQTSRCQPEVVELRSVC